MDDHSTGYATANVLAASAEDAEYVRTMMALSRSETARSAITGAPLSPALAPETGPALITGAPAVIAETGAS